MPYIQMDIASATKEQKKQLIESFTHSASEILGFDESLFYVNIKENNPDNWGIGGVVLSDWKEKQ